MKINTVPRAPMLLRGTVHHTRFFKTRHSFRYRSWYVGLPLFLQKLPLPRFLFGRNSPGLLSVHYKDYGDKSGADPKTYIRDILQRAAPDASFDIDNIFFVTMPRALGHAFNPVSFWYIPDKDGALRTVLCEVHNTFGEIHSYLCLPDDNGIIQSDMTLHAKKVFHVSPFFDRTGGYRFRFTLNASRLGVFISYFGDDKKLRLTASLHGDLQPLTTKNLLKRMVCNPSPSLKTIILIHWQAVLLWVAKRIAYVPKPKQQKGSVTRAKNITRRR